MRGFFRVMAQLNAVFTAMTAVVAFKRNGLGLAMCENSWFILPEPPWFNSWSKGTAMEAIHRAEWSISKPLEHIQTTGLHCPSAQCN